MINIKWIGIIKDEDIKKYQKEELDEQAVKMKMPKSSKEQMIKAIPFLIPAIIVMFLAMVIKTYIAKDIVIKGWGILIGLLIGFILLFVHEFLHAIVYPKKIKKYIGIVKPFTPVALASYPLSKKRFVLMCLLPYILGIIPLICFAIAPSNNLILNAILWGIAFLGMVSPYPDAYNVYQVIKQVPKGKKVQFYEDDTYYI